MCFNPCFNGYSTFTYCCKCYRIDIRCFNPCFNGYSTFTFSGCPGAAMLAVVSILVLMDTLLLPFYRENLLFINITEFFSDIKIEIFWLIFIIFYCFFDIFRNYKASFLLTLKVFLCIFLISNSGRNFYHEFIVPYFFDFSKFFWIFYQYFSKKWKLVQTPIFPKIISIHPHSLLHQI